MADNKNWSPEFGSWRGPDTLNSEPGAYFQRKSALRKAMAEARKAKGRELTDAERAEIVAKFQ